MKQTIDLYKQAIDVYNSTSNVSCLKLAVNYATKLSTYFFDNKDFIRANHYYRKAIQLNDIVDNSTNNSVNDSQSQLKNTEKITY